MAPIRWPRHPAVRPLAKTPPLPDDPCRIQKVSRFSGWITPNQRRFGQQSDRVRLRRESVADPVFSAIW